MGAYSPAPLVTEQLHKKIMAEIIEPTLAGLNADSIPYTGFLYAGLMITKQGDIKVLEYNCRFGDPETQPIMMRLKSDLVELCLAALNQTLDQMTTEWDNRTSLGVVMASGGYPDAYQKGFTIHGLPETETTDTKVFHAGTQLMNNEIVTSGGRVLCVCALGNDITEAKHKAYELVNQIHWQDAFFRTDIGNKAIQYQT